MLPVQEGWEFPDGWFSETQHSYKCMTYSVIGVGKGVGGLKTPFYGRGIDIKWNYTILF